MAVAIPPLAALAESAAVVGTRQVPGGQLSGVVVVFGEQWHAEQAAWQFQFQKFRRRMLLGSGLATCWVEVGIQPSRVRLISSGVFGPKQIKELGAVPGLEFPPRVIDLAAVRVDVVDVLRRLGEPGPLRVGAGAITLSLCVHEQLLAWRVLQDVPNAAFRTLMLDVESGRVLYDRVDVAKSGRGVVRTTRSRAKQSLLTDCATLLASLPEEDTCDTSRRSCLAPWFPPASPP